MASTQYAVRSMYPLPALKIKDCCCIVSGVSSRQGRGRRGSVSVLDHQKRSMYSVLYTPSTN